MNVLRFLQIYRIHVIFIICVFFSLSLYFSNESKPVRAVQADISDVISFVLSPKKWYKNIYMKLNLLYVIKDEYNFLDRHAIVLSLTNRVVSIVHISVRAHRPVCDLDPQAKLYALAPDLCRLRQLYIHHTFHKPLVVVPP